MVDVTDQGDRIDERKDLGTGDDALYAYWVAQEKVAEREERNWIKRARQIVKRYRDERAEAFRNANRLNILWSNVQTLIPTLYARTPKPDVQRRWMDQDPVGRLASILLERSITYSIEYCDFDDTMTSVVEDRLLPGRAVARVRYVPTFGKPIESDGAPDAEGDKEELTNQQDQELEPLREVDYEEVKVDYVFWEDYREGPARKWREVPWVRYRSYLTRQELIDRFGKTKAEKVSLDYTPKSGGGTSQQLQDPPPDLYKKAIVHEYWDKSKKQVVWLPPGTPDLILDKQDDPLKLPDFFPNPNPLFATTTNEKRIPVPDYVEYQDQAHELDSLTARIDALTKALQVKGLYPGENKQVLQQIFDDGTENKLIPVEDWAMFTDKMGPNGPIVWLPIQQVAETLIQLYDARDRVKALLYEITGIGDIMRGMTSPNETLGAQELKANFSTRRITPQQKSVARFARDLFRLVGGVIAEHFSAKTISLMTGYPQLEPVPQLPPPPPQYLPAPPQPQQAPQPGQPPQQPMLPMQAPQMQPNPAFQQWQQATQQAMAVQQANAQKQQQFEQAVQLIKEDGLHGFRIDIEADSTIAPDEQAEKESRTQFMREFVPFMETVVPIAQGNPAMAELAKEMVLFVVRGWRVARPLEETVEKAFAAIAQMPPNPKATGQDTKGAAPAQKGPTPADVAIKAQDNNTQLEIARQNNATKLLLANQSADQKQMELASEAPFRNAEIAMEAGRIENQHELDRIRNQTLASRSAKSLS